MITTILIIIAAVSNAFMDLSAEDSFKYDWLNKSKSWCYKYKNKSPEQGEAFLFSTTILVFLTDGWHLFQFLFHTSWQLAFSMQFDRWIVTFVFTKIFFSLLFELFYSSIKNK
jgi:hypothetical protein